MVWVWVWEGALPSDDDDDIFVVVVTWGLGISLRVAQGELSRRGGGLTWWAPFLLPFSCSLYTLPPLPPPSPPLF